MKALFVGINSSYSHTNLAIKYLYKKAEEIDSKELESQIVEYTVNDHIENIISDIISNEANYIFFSIYIWNKEYTLKIINSIKRIDNDIKIIVGGPEVTYYKELYIENIDIDYVIIGMGENSCKHILTSLINGDNLNEKIVKMNVYENDIPKIADISINNGNRPVYFETSRGCPFNCSYCLSSIDMGIIYFDLNREKEELSYLLKNNVSQIRFVDRTFNSDISRALEIWKYLLANRKDTIFHFEINPRLLNEDCFKFLENIPKDIFQFEIGIQSTNKETLEEINRGYFWKKERENILRLVSLGNIKIHGDLIAGLPYETYELFKESFNEVYKLGIDEIQLGFLKLLKGTKIYIDAKKHEYTCIDYPPYEIISNKYISYKELRKLKDIEKILNVLYNSGIFSKVIKELIGVFKSPLEMYENISEFYRLNKYFKRKISIEETFDIVYKYLIHINEKKLVSCEKIEYIIELLKYDFAKNLNGRRYWMKDHSSNFKNSIDNLIRASDKFKGISKNNIIKQYRFEEFKVDILSNNDIILEAFELYKEDKKCIICFKK